MLPDERFTTLERRRRTGFLDRKPDLRYAPRPGERREPGGRVVVTMPATIVRFDR